MKLRERIPHVSLRSTVIVGYPGETEAEFEQLCAFIKEAEFDHLGVFAYSHEEGTASYSLPDQLPEELKQARREKLMALQQKISKARLKKQVGETVEVLVERVSDESDLLWQGRHQGQAPDIDGVVLLRNGDLQPGQIRRVKLDQAMEYDFIGTVQL